MELLHKTTTMPGQKGKFPYLCRMKKETSNNEAYPLTPYTKEELDAMIDEAEQDFEAGRFYTTEEVLMEIEEEIKKEKKNPCWPTAHTYTGDYSSTI